MDKVKELIDNCQKCHSLGINFDKLRIENFILSRRYKPEKVKILWIVESPPLSEPPRYFYRPELTQYDGLYREIMKVLGIPLSNPKDVSLKHFSDLGHYLIDSMKCPADKKNSYLKPTMVKNCASILAQEIVDIDPERIIIIKADIFNSVYATTGKVNMSNRVLNKQPIPFPGSGQQVRFRSAVNTLLNQGSSSKVVVNNKPHIKTSQAKSIIVDNFTESDKSSNQVRITIANKHLFPAEKLGQPQVYNISLVYNGNAYDCTYRIGSKDGKSRSGILKLGSELINNMRLNPNDNVAISVISSGQYEIKKI